MRVILESKCVKCGRKISTGDFATILANGVAQTYRPGTMEVLAIRQKGVPAYRYALCAQCTEEVLSDILNETIIGGGSGIA